MSFGQRFGMDFTIFKEKQTWKAFAISVVLFSIIAYSALGVTNLSSSFQTSDDIKPVADFELQTVNRTGIEDNVTNETGWFRLSEHRGKVIVLDFMAHDCSACHVAQEHLEANMDEWQSRDAEHELLIIGVGSWYRGDAAETLGYLNSSDNEYHVPHYPTGLASTEAVIVNATSDERADMRETYGIIAIPVLMVIDDEGYGLNIKLGGVGDWGDFDSAITTAMDGEGEDIRIGVKSTENNMTGVLFFGLMLSILVYFSPCAFPVLPGFISYYISLGAREDELLESGKIKKAMPNSVTIGLMSGLGMWTFFLFIGIIALIMGDAFAKSGLIHYLALGIAALLLVLGFFMLTGGTAHFMGWVQKIVDKYSTTETDEVFTPRRNMYLYGLGYAAASIDCTAAAVLPSIVWWSTLGGNAVMIGLGSLMFGLMILMVLVTVFVGLGRNMMVDFLRRSTGTIKMIGSWMMMFAGFGLILFLTNPKLFSF